MPTSHKDRTSSDELSAICPDGGSVPPDTGPEERLQRDFEREELRRECQREERAVDRWRQTLFEFSILFLGTHWFFHGLTLLTTVLLLLSAAALARATERFFLGRYAVTFLALLPYGVVLNCTPTLSPVGLIGSILLISAGTQVLRIPRESEWQGA